MSLINPNLLRDIYANHAQAKRYVSSLNAIKEPLESLSAVKKQLKSLLELCKNGEWHPHAATNPNARSPVAWAWQCRNQAAAMAPSPLGPDCYPLLRCLQRTTWTMPPRQGPLDP